MSDQQNVPTAKSLDKMGSNEVSTASDRAPAAPQVRAAVARRPPTRTEAKSVKESHR